MKKTSKPIVFFGSGPVAAESLRLLARDFTIEAVVTKPRAPHHRGPVPVIELAEALQLPIYTVENKSTLDTLIDQDPFQAELGVLIDFGIIVSQKVIDYFPLGIINSHFSILPEWRGADPITFSILSGQPDTGVSLMLLTAGMDEGPLIAYGSYDLPPAITTPELTDGLIDLSHALLIEMIPQHIEKQLQGIDQRVTSRDESYSRKLTKDDGTLDWTKPAAVLEREIRAFIEWPKSRAKLGTVEAIITKAHVAKDSGKAGSTTIIDKLPAVYTADGAFIIDRLKPMGKKEMTGEAFLAGYKHAFLN
ncbi:MAG TPA: methionyl-tRNA formyltransferase [Candidatus Saccharimonadales bacterium]|nr:methionyl-tRNA formyltransferase [Candidatus Saccharimonadales bacterium]